MYNESGAKESCKSVLAHFTLRCSRAAEDSLFIIGILRKALYSYISEKSSHEASSFLIKHDSVYIIQGMLQQAQELHRIQEEQHKSWYLSVHHDLVPYPEYRLHKADPGEWQTTKAPNLH